MDSDVQSAWIALAADIRCQIAERVRGGEVAGLSPEDLGHLVDAAQEVYWLEQNAHLFDKKVQDERLKLYCDRE